MRYEACPDGSLANGSVFVDATASNPGEQSSEGLKVDGDGNVYIAAPGGIWIVPPDGRELGRIAGPEQHANVTFGADDGRSLYICRMPFLVPGAGR